MEGTGAYLDNKADVSKQNSNFLGLARYDDKTNRYAFFDAKQEKAEVILEYIS